MIHFYHQVSSSVNTMTHTHTKDATEVSSSGWPCGLFAIEDHLASSDLVFIPRTFQK